MKEFLSRITKEEAVAAVNRGTGLGILGKEHPEAAIQTALATIAVVLLERGAPNAVVGGMQMAINDIVTPLVERYIYGQ